jgi:HEAT repeat protein
MALFPSSTITTSAALRDLASDKPKVRLAAAQALGDAEPERRAEVVDALLGSLDDIDRDVRASSALALGDLGDHRAVEPLILRLDDGAPGVRQCAAVALGRLRAGFDALCRALEDGPPDLRFQAATSLCEIDPARALRPLIAALEDSDGEVVGAAALALGSIGDPEAIEPLAARLRHPTARTRFDVAYALAGLGDARAATALATAAGEPDLAWDAIEGLEAIGAGDRLAELIDKAPDPEHQLRAAAALLICAPDHHAAPRARKALEVALVGWRQRRRALAIELIVRVGGDWGVTALERLAVERPRLRDEIASALGRDPA